MLLKILARTLNWAKMGYKAGYISLAELKASFDLPEDTQNLTELVNQLKALDCYTSVEIDNYKGLGLLLIWED